MGLTETVCFLCFPGLLSIICVSISMNDMGIIEAIISKEKGDPTPDESVAAAEEKLGFSSPLLLREIYLKVANGGIGPGYKILGVKGGHTSDEGDSIEELYSSFMESDPDDKAWKWPKGLLAFCHWGCAIYSCIDTTKEGYPVVWSDPNLRDPEERMDQAFIDHRPSFESWLQGWLDGVDLWAETYGNT